MRVVHRRLRIAASVLVTLGLLLPLFTRDVRAGGIETLESTASYSFAQQLRFTLRASSEADITQVYLFFRAKGDQQTETAAITLERPSPEISLDYVHDLRRYPLPPFTTVAFWWKIEDAAGNELETEHRRFEYTDNRFHWEHLSEGRITVHWIEGEGDPVFAQAALDTARASLAEINAELRAPVPDPIDIYLYNTQENLAGAMLLTGRDWVGGQARPELGVIAVAVPSEEGYTSRMKRYIPHEVTHLLVYELVTPPGYRHVPEWLDEGLATANEQLPTPEYTLALEEAREERRLISLQELCVPFSPNPNTATLAYAQSASVVKFIRERFGANGIRALLAAYADGASCAGGVQETLNVSLQGLETSWQASLQPDAPWRAWLDQIGVWMELWVLTMLVAVPMIGRLTRRRRGSARQPAT